MQSNGFLQDDRLLGQFGNYIFNDGLVLFKIIPFTNLHVQCAARGPGNPHQMIFRLANGFRAENYVFSMSETTDKCLKIIWQMASEQKIMLKRKKSYAVTGKQIGKWFQERKLLSASNKRNQAITIWIDFLVNLETIFNDGLVLFQSYFRSPICTYNVRPGRMAENYCLLETKEIVGNHYLDNAKQWLFTTCFHWFSIVKKRDDYRDEM
eukprot:TCONS_00019150-protein